MGSVGTIIQANNITRVAKARYQQQVQETSANNRREAARVTLAEFSRTLGNQMRLDAAGKEYNYAMSQLSHELEQSGKARLNNQLQHAEAQGALTAQASAFGVGGASVELMDQLIDLREATKAEQINRGVELMAANGKRQTAQIIVNATNGQDISRTFGNFDYSRYIEPERMKRRLGKLIGVAVATYFGGPQAGEAMADFAVGTWQADNGDFAGANKNFGQAARGATAAWQDYNDRGGGSWFSTVTQGSRSGGGNSAADVDMGQGLNLFETDSGSSGWGGWSWG